MRKKRLYWSCQIIGWGAYVVLIALFNRIRGVEFQSITYVNLALTFVIGIITSHAYRNFIIRFNWLKFKIARLIPLVLLASFVLAFLFFSLHTLISEVLIMQESLSFNSIDILGNLINLSANYILWTLLYWSFHFIQNYRKEEIKNLQWQATINEMELNKIKSQLNPHFIFNSMNSIRALINENPVKAKNAITQLSNILRSSLYMERKPLIPFKEELSLVRDYLELEKARLEDRLEFSLDIGEPCYEFSVPPLLIQTLVENGIKHGISHEEKGGVIRLEAQCDQEKIHIVIANTGTLGTKQKDRPGIGLKISHQRLKLLYGDKAKLELYEDGKFVKAELFLPREQIKKEIYEYIDR